MKASKNEGIFERFYLDFKKLFLVFKISRTPWKTIHKKLLYWRIHLLPVWKGLIKKKEGMLSAESRSNKDKGLDKKSTSNRSVYIYIF